MTATVAPAVIPVAGASFVRPSTAGVGVWISKHLTEAMTIVTISSALVASFAVAQYQIAELRESHGHLSRVQSGDHDTITEIRQDVRWIRDTLAKESK